MRRSQGDSILMGMDFVFTVEVVGIALGVIGLILTIVVCALPTWIVTTIIQANVANTEVVTHGLWMRCVTQGKGQTQCEVYNSMWDLPDCIQPVKAMILTAIILGVLGVTISMVGAKCTYCIKDETSQTKLIIIAGILFILDGILILSTLFLVTITVQTNCFIQYKGNFELGNSLYFGWVAAALLLIGGFILCINVGVFGWMMGIFGWIVSLMPCYISVLFILDPYRDTWTFLMTTSISSILGALGVMGSIFGTRCCNCIKNNRTRVKARFIVGIFFILAGILQFTNVFLNYYLTHNFPEYWRGLLISFAEHSRWAASMLLIGGTILCCSTLKKKPDSTTTKSISH
ncbi:claudin-3-like [Oncorhynchus kisutch]|uniref:claudin-3-like n=1 Tax=Oncorhynchus kisutch TaxID=8019 RepID=UPI0009A0502A|nr:claudin-3-like [Oncorhynchus kisutch]